MSRDPYVWVVMPQGAMTPEAAFTRKYECRYHIEQRDAALPPAIIYRFSPRYGEFEVVTL